MMLRKYKRKQEVLPRVYHVDCRLIRIETSSTFFQRMEVQVTSGLQNWYFIIDFYTYLISKHLSSINLTILSIILLLVYSLLWGCKIVWGPAITMAQTSNLAVAVRTKEFLWSGPLAQIVRMAWKVGMWVTIQSSAKLASWRINLFESAVLQSSVSTNISNSWKYMQIYLNNIDMMLKFVFYSFRISVITN